jgi:hypothetical protein
MNGNLVKSKEQYIAEYVNESRKLAETNWEMNSLRAKLTAEIPEFKLYMKLERKVEIIEEIEELYKELQELD